jgi:hypothetical protein
MRLQHFGELRSSDLPVVHVDGFHNRLVEPAHSNLYREPQVECASAREYPGAMNRGTGTGLIVFGVLLGVVGAIMAFAVTVHTRGFNINTAGWILLVVGIIVLVIGITILVTGSRRSSTTVENVQKTPTGQERVEERRDWDTP